MKCNDTIAVVVTYNRKDLLLINLKRLLSQTCKCDILVVDNASTDGTHAFLEESGVLKEESVTYIRLPENLGGSGGFYEGLKFAYDNGYQWIWGMDDDAFPKETALEKLLDASKKNSDTLCFWSNCDNDDSFEDEVKKVSIWMFVGFFINRKIIDAVGFPKKEFFIYHDDSEYSYRIINNGFNILKVRDSIVEHKDFKQREFNKKMIFNLEIKFPKIPDWRMYYYCRNFLLMYSYKDINKYRTILRLIKQMIIVSIVSTSQVPVFMKGFIHGLIGKDGIVLRP